MKSHLDHKTRLCIPLITRAQPSQWGYWNRFSLFHTKEGSSSGYAGQSFTSLCLRLNLPEQCSHILNVLGFGFALAYYS